MSFITFESLYVKLQSFQVCELNTNHAIKFLKCSEKKILPNAYQKMILNLRRKLVKHSVVHSCWFTDYLTKELYHWEKTHASVTYLIDGKNSMENFYTRHFHRFSWLGKAYMHKKTSVKSHSNKNKKWHIKQNLQIHWIQRNSKAVNQSNEKVRIKVFHRYHFFGTPCSFSFNILPTSFITWSIIIAPIEWAKLENFPE